jgi:hypothetical protein
MFEVALGLNFKVISKLGFNVKVWGLGSIKNLILKFMFNV